MLKSVAGLAALLCAATSAQALVTFSSSDGNPDPGAAAGEIMLVDFENPAVQTTLGTYPILAPLNVAYLDATNTTFAAIVQDGHPGYAANPAMDNTQYMSLGTGGVATFSFASLPNLKSLSVYIGSIDTYNFVDVLSNGMQIATIGGGYFPPSNGSWTSHETNRRLFINWDPSDNVNGLRFRSTGVAFEFDSIAGDVSHMPEPASWAMFMIGFGVLGAGLRRKRANLSLA